MTAQEIKERKSVLNTQALLLELEARIDKQDKLIIEMVDRIDALLKEIGALKCLGHKKKAKRAGDGYRGV